MKRVPTLLLLLLATLIFFSTSLQASIIKGKIFYTTVLEKPCGFTCDVIAKLHTSSEWKALYENGKLKYTIKTLCPKAPFVDSEEDLLNLFDFLNTFSSDSGNTPAC
jgi:hypothetical protein